MYELVETTEVDIETERAAVAAHIKANWAAIEGLDQIVKYAQEQAFNRGRAWFESHPVWLRISAMEDARTAQLEAALPSEEERRLGPYYDRPSEVLRYMSMHAEALRKAALNLEGPWNYEKAVNGVYAELRKEYPELAKARPLGWDELAKDYSDFDGMESFDHKANAASFKGADTSTAGSGDFAMRTALPYVMYDETCQGRKAAAVLVGAIFAHFLGIVSHRNTQGLLASLGKLPVDKLPANVMQEATLTSVNPLLQALIFMAESSVDNRERDQTSAEAYATALANARVFAALPESEKEVIRATNLKDIDELMHSITTKDPDAPRREEAEAERFRGILLTLMPKPQ
jgi:hypothetical protein